jgi:hypothetical protein
MKKALIILSALLITTMCMQAQPIGLPALDKSPMDMSYYPLNYPILKIQDKATEPLIARVVYSRPRKEGRVIFGGLVEYGKVWRMGANEATEIEFFSAVRIGDKKIARGRYTLYAIVNDSNWTIILSKDTDTWGAFKYDPKQDVVRVNVPVQMNAEPVESFAMVFDKTTTGFNLIITWDLIRVALPVKQ